MMNRYLEEMETGRAGKFGQNRPGETAG